MTEQPTQDGAAGTAGPRTLNYQELRMAAEAAASFRNQKVYLVVDDKGWRVETKRPEAPGMAVIPIQSPGKPTTPPPVGFAKLGIDEETAANLLELEPGNPESRADAVFWTPAAVEKFLVPYYASVYGDQAPERLKKLIGILGAVRAPLEPVSPPSGHVHVSLASSRDSSADAGQAIAVAHMPKSEYVQVDGGLTVLVKKSEGVVPVSFSAWVG